MPQSNEIDRQAAEWAARTGGQEPSTEQRDALNAWLAADVRHVGAYAKAVAVLAQVERARAVDLEEDMLMRRTSPALSRRRIMLTGSIAASLVAVAVAVGLIGRYTPESAFSTTVGQTRVVALSDGSVATLNTDSRILVRYSHVRRVIVLERGEALFDVAKNKARPFFVEARGTQMRAVGTSFDVRVLPSQPVRILVREGVVEVKRPDRPAAAPVRVVANSLAVIPSTAPISVKSMPPTGIAHELAWRTGRIFFDDVTLAAAAREFARYSRTRIVIDDPVVAKRTVTGLYVSNDPVGFARAAALSLGLRVETGKDEVRLLRNAQ